MKTFLLYLYAESPVHAGAPDTDGAVHLPIQREQASDYPVIWGQSLKGALRQTTTDRESADLAERMFGSPPGTPDNANPRPGAVTVGDAQLVAMPIATLQRSFAWVTSSLALGRVSRKYARCNKTMLKIPHVAADGGICLQPDWEHQEQVLGNYLVTVELKKEELQPWADRLADDGIGDQDHLSPFAERFKQNLILVGDSVMRELVRNAMEIAVRVQLNEERRVENGPFTSEYLPTESLLVSVLTARDSESANTISTLFNDTILQIGGDQTLGKGLMWSRLVEV